MPWTDLEVINKLIDERNEHRKQCRERYYAKNPDKIPRTSSRITQKPILIDCEYISAVKPKKLAISED